MTLVERYIAVWNETDPQARAKAVAELWTEDATYTDPLADVSGHAGIAAVIEGAQGMFPGLVFTPGELYDAHRHLARFTWHLGPADGEPVAVGYDVVELAGDGRIRKVLGFLDKAPAA
ncbi:nuclear transport factor 2 family protein [Nonomuraea diastatica]|uniref:Nuclear transport factor 2 family protein n=1 Tax=Nonomuraea diastatica TaxID=1848329 RepID=A0A4R4X6Y3_9ACTN|nr:nuclear transport factor 2 family protein [Nonomuraea diastatica]TDD26201.1 nuclear transport factor 2 family protein [Nonomuraea diastatica]